MLYKYPSVCSIDLFNLYKNLKKVFAFFVLRHINYQIYLVVSKVYITYLTKALDQYQNIFKKYQSSTRVLDHLNGLYISWDESSILVPSTLIVETRILNFGIGQICWWSDDQLSFKENRYSSTISVKKWFGDWLHVLLNKKAKHF